MPSPRAGAFAPINLILNRKICEYLSAPPLELRTAPPAKPTMSSTPPSPCRSPTRPVLPPELIYAVVEELKGDNTSLIACTLSGRVFLDPAQKHLFSQLTVISGKFGAKFTKLAASLRELPAITSYVHTLTLSGIPYRKATIGIPTFSVLITTLRSLHTIRLSDLNVEWGDEWYWMDLIQDPDPRPLRAFSLLRTFIIADIRGFTDLFRYISTIDHVEFGFVALDRLLDIAQTCQDLPATSPILDIRSYSFQCARKGLCVNFARQVAFLHPPRTLEITLGRQISTGFRELFQEIGPHLRSLALSFREIDSDVDLSSIQMTHCTFLVDLSFGPGIKDDLTFTQCLRVLNKISNPPPTTLRRVTFRCRASILSSSDDSPWVSLQGLLGNFPGLKTLVFDLSSDEKRLQGWHHHIANNLPQLDGKRILSFVGHKD